MDYRGCGSAERGRLGEKTKLKDPAYLAFLHTLPCACAVIGEDTGCYGPIHAHHAGARGFGRKCSDREAVPLCLGHHLDGPNAVHRLGKKFWKTHGLDRYSLIGELNRVYDMVNDTSGVKDSR